VKKVVEVFFVNEEVPASGPTYTEAVSGHPCTGAVTYKMDQIMPEIDQQVLKVVSEIADEKELTVKLYDVATWKGRLKALLKGVKETPTVVVGDKRIVGPVTRDELENLLKERSSLS